MNAKQLYEKQKCQWKLQGGVAPLNLPTRFTNFERQIVYGSMLGDGGTRFNGKHPGWNEGFQEGHSIKQELYLRWKIDNCFSKWMKNPANIVYSKGSESISTVKGGPSVRLFTSACSIFTVLGHKWYRRADGHYVLDQKGWRIKTLPRDIIEVMSSKDNYGLGLAVWYMDDGCCFKFKYHTGSFLMRPNGSLCMVNRSSKNSKTVCVSLASCSFNEEENHVLCDDLLWDKFGIKGAVRYKKSLSRYLIDLTSSGSQTFLSIVGPWVEQVSCMRYKVIK
jgi:hypothetical protein